MSNNSYAIGGQGERLAIRFLKSKGFQIIDTNVHLGKYAELDIIAQNGDQIHIVEVKTIQMRVDAPEDIQFPIYNITPRKLRHIIMGTEMYLRNHSLSEALYSIDAVCIVIDQEKKKSWVRLFSNITEGL